MRENADHARVKHETVIFRPILFSFIKFLLFWNRVGDYQNHLNAGPRLTARSAGAFLQRSCWIDAIF